MNNPPDISQDPSEHEEYAHNVQKHVRGYLMVGATLLAFTAITVALSYVNFGAPKANIAVAMLVATFKAGLVAAIFMHLARKTPHLSHSHFYRFLCARTFLAYFSRVVRLPGCSLNVA